MRKASSRQWAGRLLWIGALFLLSSATLPGGCAGALLLVDVPSSTGRRAQADEVAAGPGSDLDLGAPDPVHPGPARSADRRGAEELFGRQGPRTSVPEPGTLLLLGFGALALETLRRRKAGTATPRAPADAVASRLSRCRPT